MGVVGQDLDHVALAEALLQLAPPVGLEDLAEGGEALRSWIDAMPNEQFQSLFGLSGAELRERFLDGAPEEVVAWSMGVPDGELGPLVTDLGGHDLSDVLEEWPAADPGLLAGGPDALRRIAIDHAVVPVAYRGSTSRQPADHLE